MFLNSPVAKKLGITEVQFVYYPAELWPDRIESAKKQGISIDVAWGGGPTLFNILDDAGYLMPINPQQYPEHYAVTYELSKVPKTVAGAETYKVDLQGNVRWIGASISSFGFTVNRDVLARYGLPMAKSWSDLADPEYARYLPAVPLIGIADPTLSTSNLRIFEIILQAKGWEEGWKILTLMAANSRVYPGSGDARDAVIKGDVAIATTIDFYGYMAVNINPDCVYIAPEGETIVNSDPIAIISITKYPVHAAAFVAWVLSEFGGQQVWLNKDINRIPINPKTFETSEGASRPDLKKAFETLTTLRGIVFNETLSSSWVNSVMYYFKATLVNAHEDLQAVWAQVASAYLEGRITKEWFDYLVYELSKPLRFTDPVSGQEAKFTLEYAILVNTKLKEGPVYQALMSAWESGARTKYKNVLTLLNKAVSGEPIPTVTTTTTQTATTTPTTTAETWTSITTTPTSTSIAPETTIITSPATPPTAPITTPPTTPPTGQPEGISPTLLILVGVLVVVIIIMVLLRRR